MDILRTPDERFAEIMDFPYEPRYREWEGMRLAHIDEGEPSAPTVVMLHGEPTWSYLWRKAMPPLLDAGYRCVVPDLPGFGRSDKPTDPEWYSHERHTKSVVDLFETLGLSDVSLVAHDWGGAIGLRAATLEIPDRIPRIVVMNTGVFDGRQKMTRQWHAFKNFVKFTPVLPIKRLVRAGCKNKPSEDVLRAYDAPFPNRASKAGAKAFPELVPLSSDEEGADVGVRGALEADARPSLVLWGDSDTVLPLDPFGRAMAKLMTGEESLAVVEGGGHFLQEDKGEFIGARIAEWLAEVA